jgi:hypothetical protein
MFWNGKPDSPVFPDLPNLVISRRILHKEHDFWEFSLGGFGEDSWWKASLAWWGGVGRLLGFVREGVRLREEKGKAGKLGYAGPRQMGQGGNCWAVQDNRNGKKRKGHGPALRIQPKRLVRKEIPF